MVDASGIDARDRRGWTRWTASAQVVVPDIVDEAPAAGCTASTWQWELRRRSDGTRTRLSSANASHSPGSRSLIWRLVEPIDFVMERKMIKGIKGRPER